MEYKITGNFNENYLQEYLALWKFSSREAFDAVKIYSVCCLVYIFFLWIDYHSGKRLSIFLGTLGLTTLLLLLIQVWSIYRYKKLARNIAAKRIQKYQHSPDMFHELHFTEDSLAYSDPEMMLQIKWNAISHYKEHKNYMFFFWTDSGKPIFSMDKTNIPTGELSGLLEFINLKLYSKSPSP